MLIPKRALLAVLCVVSAPATLAAGPAATGRSQEACFKLAEKLPPQSRHAFLGECATLGPSTDCTAQPAGPDVCKGRVGCERACWAKVNDACCAAGACAATVAQCLALCEHKPPCPKLMRATAGALPTCASLSPACANSNDCGNCQITVCTDHTCGVGCTNDVYLLQRQGNCYVGADGQPHCNYWTDGRIQSGGGPPWFSDVDSRRWFDCTGQPATPPVCYNDFLARGIAANNVNCTVMANVAACCGPNYISAVGCGGGPPLACNCYNCGQPK